MNIIDFKKQIKNSELQPFYILVGEEIGMINYYLDHIQLPTKRVDNVASIWKTLTQPRLLGGLKEVFIVRDDKDFMRNEKVWDKVKTNKHNILIFLTVKADNKLKFFKHNKDNLVEFERTSSKQLMQYFEKKYPNFLADMISVTIDRCSNDFDRIENELDKLNCLQELNEVTETNYTDFITEMIQVHETIDVFELSNNIINKNNFIKSFDQVNTLLNRGESMFGLLTLLYNNFIRILKVKGTSSPTEDSVGITNFQIMLAKKAPYNAETALDAVQITQDAIEGITQGRYTEREAILFTLLKLT